MTTHTETQAMCERMIAWLERRSDYPGYGTTFAECAALLTRQQEEIERLEDKVADLRLGQRAEIQRADTHRDALAMLYMATEGAIEETPDPHRVFFDDGFVIDGRAADEWHKFMMLIQRVRLPAKGEAENALDAGQAMTREEMIDEAIMDLGVNPNFLRWIDRDAQKLSAERFQARWWGAIEQARAQFTRIAAREAKT